MASEAALIPEIRQLMQNDPAAAAAKFNEYLNTQLNTPLNIAITGESGAGKSTFVNYFRGLNNADEGAAPTGCTETTIEATPYPHPKYPNVTVWDLPGVGTTKFPADNYLEHFEFKKFDFFILISDTRFRENDVKLAREIKRMEKKFYFVRSKIDNDLKAEERSQRDFSTEKTLEKLRKSCIEGLQAVGFKAPQVFLLSCFELCMYDFLLLHKTLERELPEHKKHVLLLAMPIISLEIINKKKEVFQANIKYLAAASAVVAAVPVPGLSVAVDLSLMVAAIKQYVDGFCLDVISLERLALVTKVPLGDLLALIKTPLNVQNLTGDLILKYLSQIPGLAAEMAIEEGFSFIPLLGIPVAMTLSAVTTYKALNFILDFLAEDAQRVFRRALGLDTSE